jgi:hypothetical protein
VSATLPALSRRPLLLGLVVLCLVLGCLGISVILSALFNQQTNRFLNDWQVRGEQPSERAWLVAYNAANKAINLYPGEDASLYNNLGRVLEWKQFSLPTASEEAKKSREAALQAYRLATELRPTLPHFWADLALIKTRLNQTDDELVNALENAMENGPWRVTVLLRITQVGLLNWWQLSDEGRSVTLKAITRGLSLDHRSANQIWSSITLLQGEDVVCATLRESVPWLEKQCI